MTKYIALAQNNTQAPLIVLLQGPVGPFFSSLAKYLRGCGYRVININFNLGDALQTRGFGTFLFRGSPERWGDWFRAFLIDLQPMCVILFGDQRIYHMIAVKACNEFKVDVWCVEEGYLRPDYITFERGGNNAASLLARIKTFEPVRMSETSSIIPIRGNSFRAMALRAVPYYIVNSLNRLYVKKYLHHRTRPLSGEALFWARNFFRKWTRKLRNAKGVIDLLEHHHEKYFIVALQVYDDLNLIRHGRGWSNQMMIKTTILSFATNASPDDLLVIKCHPFDRGHWSYDKIIDEVATLAGIRDRIRVIDDAPLGVLLRQSRGLVNINSTSGILAIRLGCPVFVLGDALYRQAGLAQFGEITDLDRFWRNPALPDPEIASRFFNYMIQETQINGSLYQKEYYSHTFNNISSRIASRNQ